MGPVPHSPESSARLASAETNPLPHVSSAKAWTALSFPKANPVIREKPTAPQPPRRIRADGTEEICVEDIMVIVPRPKDRQPAPALRAEAASEELGDDDIVDDGSVAAAPEATTAEIPIEHAPPAPRAPEPFRAPAYSVHATQEILADDVLDVQLAQDERPSTVPWTVDNPLDEFEFPQAPQHSGAYGAVRRITNYSATQVFRRRNLNVKVVAASVGLALSLVVVAGIARFAPTNGAAAEGPVGIAMRAPKKLDKAVRGRTLAYGTARHLDSAITISIDSLPSQPIRRRR